MSERVRASFDRIAEQYAADFADELTRKPYDTALLRLFAGGCPAGPVLDVGCGPAGHVGRFVADLGRRVVGLDLAPRALGVARRLNDPTLPFVAGDVHALPFAAGAFAGVLAFYSLIYEADPTGALREMRRVLRPEGTLLVAVHAGHGVQRFTDYTGVEVDVELHLHAPRTFAPQVVDAGLRVERMDLRPPYPFEHKTERLYVLGRAG